MTRTFVSFPIKDIKDCKKRMLSWANQFSVCCFLDNNDYSFSYNSYECILAAGVITQLSTSAGKAFSELKEFCFQHQDWVFGHLGYDLKNEQEQLQSAHPDGIAFPDLFFFVPQFVLLLNNKTISIGCSSAANAQHCLDEIFKRSDQKAGSSTQVDIKSRFTKDEYIATIHRLQRHIHMGDCYEINFCQEFFSADVVLDPLQVYFSLSEISPNPFAAYYKVDYSYLCCASPERYLKKEGKKIISQPIKGTSRRDPDNQTTDLQNRNALFNSGKDRTENVMIVDLVRNDLSKVCEEGSVIVDELYGIYSYPQVHQMISTVSGILKEGLDGVDALSASFPMGSMTGAPKKRVMELIELYEKTKRGVFSGALGYITPTGDFDFNVVIRSILYNSDNRYLSYQVGSAITFQSEPEEEYEECMIKAAAIRTVLS